MNIWIFNHYAVGPNSSGITRHYDLAKELVKLGHNVRIFASSFNHQKRKEEQLYPSKTKVIKKEYKGVVFYWIKTPPYYKNDFKRVLNMIAYSIIAYNFAVEKTNEKPDYVIGSLMHPLAAIIGLKVAEKYNAKFIFEERDLWPQSLIDLGKVSAKNPLVFLLDKLESYLYKKADKIILLFKDAIKYVKSKGVEESKILYLPNGVDIRRYGPVRANLPKEIDERLEHLKGKFVAIYTGAHGLANNLDIILDSARLLKDNHNIHFLLVGDGPEKKRLLNIKEKFRLENLTFIDSVPKEYIPSILEKADVGLLPLKNSPVFKWGISPNKLYDYMAASLPIILLCNINEPTIINSESGIIIKENFAKNLSEELVRLSNQKDLVNKLGSNGRSYLEKFHTWSILAKKFDKELR